METAQVAKTRPSARWTSADDWNYNGMKERIEMLLAKLDKSVLVQHTESILKQPVTLSEPFSAGQYWICFEMVAPESGQLVIARVRLPRHPDIPEELDEQSELHSIRCEVQTMRFIKDHLTDIVVPEVYAYAEPSSKYARNAGAAYMLIEGFYGNTLQDVAFDLTSLPVEIQEHIITQWTAVQAKLASVSSGMIGSICSTSADGKACFGPLASAAVDGLEPRGPFSYALSYFRAVGKARYARACKAGESLDTKLVICTFMDIVDKTDIFASKEGDEFYLNHMDMGTQNILVDDEYNFLAVIDWEFAQTAPWQANYFPMPFPLTVSDAELEEILQNLDHLAHSNVSRQSAARSMYKKKMIEAEENNQVARPGRHSIGNALDGPACRIYGCLHGISGFDESNRALAYEMIRLAYALTGAAATQYIDALRLQVSAV